MADLTETEYDFIVVGSGPTGTMCAQTLVESGQKVLMLDGGVSAVENEIVSAGSFEEIRKSSRLQPEIFLGKQYEGSDWGPTKAGSQLTPQRKYVTETAKEWIPLETDGFQPFDSLAYGGLGSAWGLGCCMFSRPELEKAGLPVEAIQKAYEVVAGRIGVSYTPDDIEPYAMPGIQQLQPAVHIDDNASHLLHHYAKKRDWFVKKNISAGVPALALLTKDLDERKATDYSDMDFYENRGISAWRPAVTLEQLKK